MMMMMMMMMVVVVVVVVVVVRIHHRQKFFVPRYTGGAKPKFWGSATPLFQRRTEKPVFGS